MGHSVHPYAHRIGILRDWRSRWFNTKQYTKFLKEDVTLREWLMKKLRTQMISGVEIERSRNTMQVIVRTPRPGLLIGRGGEGIERLKKDIHKKFAIKDFRITIEEVRNPFGDAASVARLVAQDLEKRLPFRRTLKINIQKVMTSGAAKGIRIQVSGRLDGSEMGRVEWLRDGSIPLQTMRADVEFARERAILPYGTVGIKVWLYKGEVFAEDKKGHTKDK
ncbi:MAG: 30S ribosomal protein S3 [Candidatus Ryanbacteria bacterium]|nr:30S ribosomal protein S3 [Candidatus Ryanbacteria bacterium]